MVGRGGHAVDGFCRDWENVGCCGLRWSWVGIAVGAQWLGLHCDWVNVGRCGSSDG